MIQFGSLITYGLGHISSSIFEPYQVTPAVDCEIIEGLPAYWIIDYLSLLRIDHCWGVCCSPVGLARHLVPLAKTDSLLR